MKKKLLGLGLMALSVFALGLSSCGGGAPTEPTTNISVAETYIVAFEVDGSRYHTCYIEHGEKITETITDPKKDGYTFEGWYEGTTLIDLATYVVTKDVTFTAAFEEIPTEPVDPSEPELSVNDVKEAGKEYYLVFGWWEVDDPAEPDKVTSTLTEDTVKVFYKNIIKYLEIKGATDADIKNIQFRNYSTATVADMGAKINADGDVDLIIGVGKNVFTSAGCLPYGTSDDSKFETSMGTEPKSRYVALLQNADEMAKGAYDWLQTETGKETFIRDVTENEIRTSLGEPEAPVNPSDLSIDDVKEAGKEYFLVFGWWETPSKVTSTLTPDTVKLFYANIINLLKAINIPDSQISNIQFRNYSTEKVAEMGTLVNTDGDVDILIGVGTNIFDPEKANVTPYNTDEDSRFGTEMGSGPKERQVALVSGASVEAVSIYTWLQTEVGRASFLRELTPEEIQSSIGEPQPTIDLTLTVHGDVDATVKFETGDETLVLPAMTPAEGYALKGLSLTENGEKALDIPADNTITYEMVKDLAGDAKTLDLYPYYELIPVVTEDLVVLIQTHATRLPSYEAELLIDRFSTTVEDKDMEFHLIEENADGFEAAYNEFDVVDVVIGGNKPIDGFGKHADGPTVNAGLKHFKNDSRKVNISDKVHADHLELAKQLYNFVAADAIAYDIHTTFWHNNNKWLSVEEIAAFEAGIKSHINTYLSVEEGTLEETYNVTVSFYSAENTKVAALGEETRALREGKGTDLIIGCGKNVDSDTGGQMVIVEKKIMGAEQHAYDGGRYAALVRDSHITRDIYENYISTRPEA